MGLQCSVAAGLVNYRRPQNIAPIIESLNGQSLAPTQTFLLDQSAHPDFRVPPNVREQFTYCLDSNYNFGAFARYILCSLTEADYVWFVDDDLVPGPACCEHFARCALSLKNRFVTLGQIGRILGPGLKYEPVDVLPGESPREVDFVVRSYFYPAEHLAYVETLRRGNGLREKPREDDLFTQGSIAVATGYRSLLVPQGDDDTKINMRELWAPHAHSGATGHWESRDTTVRYLVNHGFAPLET